MTIKERRVITRAVNALWALLPIADGLDNLSKSWESELLEAEKYATKLDELLAKTKKRHCKR